MAQCRGDCRPEPPGPHSRREDLGGCTQNHTFLKCSRFCSRAQPGMGCVPEALI